MRSPVLVITVVVLAWFPWSLQARDVFVVTARTTDGTNIVRTAGDSNFFDLLERALESNGEFANLTTTTWTPRSTMPG